MGVPKVSIGMPVFNRAPVLKSTLQQVLDQTWTDYELVIYNDGSRDESAEIVRSFTDPRIKFIDQPNLGPPHPLNKLLEVCQGEYIIILHDHDFFHPELLEKSVAALDKHPEAGFVLQGSAWIDEDGVSNYRAMLHSNLSELNNGFQTGAKMLLSNVYSSIFHACSMVRRTALEAVGKHYPVEFGLYADGDLWLRILRKFDFVYIPEVLFKFRTRESTGHFLSDRQFDILNWQYQIFERNINLYFSEGSRNWAQAKENNQSKWKREFRNNLLYGIANDRPNLVGNGLEYYNIHQEGLKSLSPFIRAIKMPFIQSILRFFLVASRPLRNLLRG